MLYATTCFWLVAAILMAWGVLHIWESLLKPKTLNTILLPATIVNDLTRVVALLVTGGTFNSPSGGEDDKKGGGSPTIRPKLPILGPVIVALLPMAALGAIAFLVMRQLGMPVVERVSADLLSKELPRTMGAFWEQLRASVTLAEQTLAAIRADGLGLRGLLLAYLMVCCTVRLAPMPANVRGHLGAVAVLGVLGWLTSTLSPLPPDLVTRYWPFLVLVVGWLLLLLMISLLVRGAVSSVQMLLKLEG